MDVATPIPKEIPMKNSMSMTTAPSAEVRELDLDQTHAAGGAVDKDSFGYHLGYVIGAIEAKVMDAYESVFGNVEGA